MVFVFRKFSISIFILVFKVKIVKLNNIKRAIVIREQYAIVNLNILLSILRKPNNIIHCQLLVNIIKRKLTIFRLFTQDTIKKKKSNSRKIATEKKNLNPSTVQNTYY